MENFVDTLIVAALAALPGLVVSAFAWFKARAATTPAKWDDSVVKAIEDIAGGVKPQ